MDETTLTDHIESLDAIPAWAMDIYDGSDDLNLAALLKLVGSLDRARKALAETRDALGAKAAQLMDDKQAIVDGYGFFERRSAVKRVTDWDAILDRIATRSLYDADGEAVADPAIAVSRHEALVRSII
jgi:predicted Abi (CAAX) family protease